MEENFEDADRDHVDRMFDAFATKPKDRRKKWTMASGEKIAIRDMTDRHLVNAIRYFRRNAQGAMRRAEMQGMALACCVSGEMAGYTIDQGLRDLEEMDPEDFLATTVSNWDGLLREAKRRKIEVPL